MAKVLTTIYRIEGVLDGSLISAIQRASSAMKGLKAASTGKIDIGRFGELQSKLAELQKVQAAMLRLKQLQGEMGKSWAAAREKTSSYGKLQGEVNLSRAALEQLKRQMSELKTQRDTSTGSARREASEQLRVLKEQYALRQSQLREMEQRLKSSKRETTAAQGNYASQAAELRQLSSALNAAGISARNFAGAEQSLKSAIDTTTAALKAQERLSSALKAHNDAGENLNTAWGNVSNTMSTAASIMQPFKAAVDNAENFEHEMSRVKALTQSDNIRKGFYAQTASEMKELEAQARELGATTQFTMTQAAQAQGFLGMAGWSKDQIIKAMPGMLDLAAASGMDLARTADIVSDNLTALGMDATQVGHMTDVYAYALTRSNLNMEALGESMKYAAPAMHAYGGDIHDAAAAMMIMGNAGIKGSMAGTALRMGLLRLAGPPKKATKEMEALGISLSDATRMAYESQAQLEALGIHVDDGMQPTEKMKYVLEELGQKMQGLSKDEKLAAVGAIFGVNAASGWLAVLEQGPEQFANFRDALRKSDGTAKQIAKTMNDDTRGAWLYLESAIDAVSNNIGSAFLPALKSTYEGLNPVVTSMAQWIGEHPGVVQGFGAIAAAAAGGMVALGGFRVAMAGVSFVTTTIEMMQATAALQSLTAMTGGAAGAFAKLSALSTIFQTQGLVTGIRTIGFALQATAQSAMGFLLAPWSAMMGGLTGAFTKLGAVIATVQAHGLISTFRMIGLAMQSAAASAASFIFSPWGVALGAIAAIAAAAYLIYSNWDQLAPYFEGIMSRLSSAIDGAFARIEPAIGRLGAAWTAMTSAFDSSGLGELMTAGVLSAIEVVVGAITTAITLVGTFVTTIADIGAKLAEAFGLLMEGRIVDAIMKVGEAFSSGLGGAIKMVGELIKGVYETIMRVVDIGRGLIGGKLLSGDFDYGGGSRNERLRARHSEKLSELTIGATQLNESEREKTTLSVREAARGGGTNEQITASVLEKLSNIQNQTGARQAEMLSLVTKELASRKDMTAERKGEIVTAIREGMQSKSESTTEQITSALAQYASEKVGKDEASQAAFVNSMRETLSATQLSAQEQNAAMMGVLEKMAQQESRTELTESITKAMADANMKTLESRDQATAELLAYLKSDQKSDMSTKLEAALEYLKTQTDVNETSRNDMMSQIREGLQESVGTQIGEQVSAAIKESSDQSQLVSELTSVLSAQEDRSAASVEMMMSSVQSALEASGQRSSEEITTIMSELRTSMQSSMEEQRAAAAETFTQLQQSSTQAGASMEQAGQLAMQLGVSSEQAGAMVQMLSAGAAAAGEAAAASAGSIGGLGSSAQEVAGALSGAAAQISSIQINVPQVNYIPMNVPVGGHAEGGIFAKGAHLTWFAERSAEAAIPIDNSTRSIALWRTTGAMLGVLPQSEKQLPIETTLPPMAGQTQIPILPQSKLPMPIETKLPPIAGQGQIPILPQSRPPMPQSRPKAKSLFAPSNPIIELINLLSGGRQESTSSIPNYNSSATSIQHPYNFDITTLQRSQSVFAPRNPMLEQFNEMLTTTLSTTRTAGIIPSALSEMENTTSTSNAAFTTMPPLELHFHFEGNVDREEVKRGVSESIPMIRESWEEQRARWLHEESRRSY